MRPKLKRSCIVIIFLAAVVSAAGTLRSRESYMRSLPVYRRYRCLLCHRSATPVSGQDLNSFGADFKKNGYAWNATLALKDSDGDSYPNGDELGDEERRRSGRRRIRVQQSRRSDELPELDRSGDMGHTEIAL